MDKKISQLSATTSPKSEGLVVVVQDGNTFISTLDNLFNTIKSGINITSGVVKVSSTPDTIGSSGAISLTTPFTNIANNSGSTIFLTLANGSTGQEKTIIMTADVNPAIITPTLSEGYTSITFDQIGQTVKLQFVNNKWNVISVYGAVVA